MSRSEEACGRPDDPYLAASLTKDQESARDRLLQAVDVLAHLAALLGFGQEPAYELADTFAATLLPLLDALRFGGFAEELDVDAGQWDEFVRQLTEEVVDRLA